ncbi:PepSY-associated TM helix domain-containing protein [Rhodoferax saidenbachensis]|uniref:PepSY domain-containing protein n=1 Tax=Rhodoferax saidenbachensis TaxID=1484693 RepID=A0A1P8K617_9BURK|nr:PepSY domain-containing protein [Rhodoferax saidenbachensis]APW41464.1 hypothetical protein RS694_02095 [Rhodoferax saidenbachensis]
MQTSVAQSPARAAGFHATAWRWHFYSGLYVVPFLFMLAVTGLVMVFFTGFQTRLGAPVYVSAQNRVLAVTAQAQAALASVPDGTLKEYIAPPAKDLAAWFVVMQGEQAHAVAVNPYTAEVLKTVDKGNTVFAWAEKIHGTLLLGDVGDRLIEIAAGLAVVMVVTGLYLHWPRGGSRWAEVLVPNLRAKGRIWWKSLHASIGFWLSIVLLGFLLTGMSWTGIWGAKYVQPWATFPAVKWDAVPQSDATHATLNTAGVHDVPWGLEQTPLPQSGSSAGVLGVAAGEPVNLDGMVNLATRLGFSGQFHINLPQDANGVYTLSADTMSGDLKNPTHDRTVHVDRYTGRVLAEAAFADYSPVAKAMAVGIALHQGDLGLWNALLNVAFCAGVAFLCVSGIVMWWKRRPAGAGRLVAPPLSAGAPLWKSGAVVMLLVAVAFPLSGAVLLAVVLLDWLVIGRLPGFRVVLS